MSPLSAPRAVLFDLDGTLVDSAPDLVAAAVLLCAELDQAPPDAAAVREVVSAGGRAILRRALPAFDAPRIELALPRFLDLYAQNIAVHTRLYDGMGALLEQLDNQSIRWGVVTNKAGWLARPLLEQLDLARRCAAIVCGDCLPVTKPDPAPVLLACEQAGVAPERSVFVGDDPRDVLAGRAAGTSTIAAAWGYLDGSDPASWGADYTVDVPAGLAEVLNL